MNPYIKSLNRLEFLITLSCTGQCKHCSEGEHTACGGCIDGDAAAQVVDQVAEHYKIESLMTFGGEPLLQPDAVCKIHAAAYNMKIPKRQLITNGFFSRDMGKIQAVADYLAKSGVNDICLSVDAFHQETIPLEPVKVFAKEIMAQGVQICTHPAWLVGKDAENPYNERTHEILKEFELLGIAASEGNVIFPSGNALKYLGDYFDRKEQYVNPYIENPEDIHTICIEPDGDVLGGNIYKTNIMDIIDQYVPAGFTYGA